MTSVSALARTHFEAAVQAAQAEGHPAETVARAMLALVVETWLKDRSVEDVRREILAAADNLDPDADYMFMRP